jgi:hypothetical protein
VAWAMRARSRAVALSVAISLAGCSSTATIHRVNGPAYEAKILRSDPTSLDVLGDDGRPYRVSREQVSDIDHPGNVLATVGAVLVGVAGLIAWAVATDHSQSQSDRNSAAIAVGTIYGLPSLVMAVTGGSIWLSSKEKARALEEAPMPIARTPPPDRPTYAPPWAAPPWPPTAPATSVPKAPLRLEAEPIPARGVPPADPPQSDPPSFRPAPPAPTPEPAP